MEGQKKKIRTGKTTDLSAESNEPEAEFDKALSEHMTGVIPSPGLGA